VSRVIVLLFEQGFEHKTQFSGFRGSRLQRSRQTREVYRVGDPGRSSAKWRGLHYRASVVAKQVKRIG